MKRIIYIILIVTVIILLITFLGNELSKARSFQLFGDLVDHVETEEHVVALTFDDGPGIHSEEVLQVLDEQEVKATFFLTGEEIENEPELAQLMADRGHEIGNHSYSHERMVLKSPSFIEKEVQKTNGLIREIGYKGEIHFRPPYGKKLFILPYHLSQHNQKTVMWNLEPESDPELARDSEKMITYVEEEVKPGSIILMHVMYENRKESLKAIPGMIESLKEKGYTFVTVSDLMQDQGN
ncbi:polysaccharide deacetylase family protein [Alkalibacillus aidingensis]|uniref:polysaccharide deacetylase family protein n=1 Tax=Alkalibacillus aidingensis TaxID=2747607 RepID=UPI00166052A1|nr:polysaccharide deacetylase family protein [Alkalibacillus aidingensis]